MRWLWVCVFALFAARDLVAQQAREPDFDPRPVVLAQSDSSLLRPVTGQDLLSIREPHGLSISPDGQKIAFVLGQADYRHNSYRSGLFLIRRKKTEPPVCLGSAGEPHWSPINEWVSESPQWSGDSRLLFYRMRMRPSDRWQVWRWSINPVGGRALTHVPGDVVSYRLDRARQRIVMTVELPVGHEVERQIADHGILYDRRVLPWEGMPALVTNLIHSQRSTEIWIHELKTGVERRATEGEIRRLEPDMAEFQEKFDTTRGSAKPKCQVASAEWSPDHRTALITCSFDSGQPGIMRWRMFVTSEDGRHQYELAPDSIRVTDYWWSADGSSLYFVPTKGDGHPGEIRRLDIPSGEVQTILQPAEILRDYSLDAKNRWMACTRETNLSPPRVAVIDLNDGTWKTLVDLNPEFRHLKLNSVERISGRNAYGEDWFGQLIRPAGFENGKRYPLIITLYRSGDSFLLGGTGEENPLQVYASNGFAVLSFDIGRNRERKTGDFDDYLFNWASPMASLETAVQSLVDAGIVDGARVGLAGFSHGTEILEYAISHSHVFRAAVASGPAARDPYFYYMAGATWHELFRKWGLGGWPEGESEKNWQRLAASLRADQIETPLLVNSADSEFMASLALYTSLEALHKPVELYIYANELHAKNQPEHLYEIFERNLDWFRFWLKNEEDSSPGKKKQYDRWKRLRQDWNRHAD